MLHVMLHESMSSSFFYIYIQCHEPEDQNMVLYKFSVILFLLFVLGAF